MSNNVLILDGDSITVGYGVTTPWGTLLQLTAAWTITNVAVVGRTLATCLADYSTNVAPYYNAAVENCVHIWAGTNDFDGGATVTTTYNNLKSYCAAARATGFKVIVATMLARGGNNPTGGESLDADKDAYNALIRANWPSFADGIDDVAGQYLIGADGAWNSSPWFIGDAIHPSQQSDTGIIAPMASAAINFTMSGTLPFGQVESYGFTATENPLSDGGNFATLTGLSALQVPSSGICESATVATGAAYRTGSGYQANQSSSITVKAISSAGGDEGPLVRCASGAQTCYLLVVYGNISAPTFCSAYIGKLVAGTGTQFGSTLTFLTISVGDVFTIEANGATVTCYQNGYPFFQVTDTSISSGQPGMWVVPNTAVADSQISLWAGGMPSAATPTYSPAPGTYGSAQTVTITADAGDTIYYTTNGSTPTTSSSSISSGGTVSVPSTLTLKAFATGTGLTPGAIQSGGYTIGGVSSGSYQVGAFAPGI